MGKFIMKRIAASLVTIFLLSIIIFAIAHLSKGDPAQIILGADATQEQLSTLRHTLGLDQPIVMQYIHWAGNALHGDFGNSYYSGDSVLKEAFSRISPSLTLAISAEILAVILAIPMGVIAARKRGKIADYAMSTTALLGLSIPNFLMSLFLILILGVSLKAFPVSGYRSFSDGIVEMFRYNFLPVLALALGQAGIITRMTRASMVEVLNTDYIKTAKAKGLKDGIILFKHALRNALIPIITVVGQSFGTLFASTAIVETIFNIPGVGQLVITSITRRDYAMIQGIVLLISLMWIVVNFILDLVYGAVDPRIRVGGKN